MLHVPGSVLAGHSVAKFRICCSARDARWTNGDLLGRRSRAHLLDGRPGPVGQPAGYYVYADQFLGFRFFVDKDVTSGSIGGHFAILNGLDIFGALVALENNIDYPDSLNLSTADVLGGVDESRSFRRR